MGRSKKVEVKNADATVDFNEQTTQQLNVGDMPAMQLDVEEMQSPMPTIQWTQTQEPARGQKAPEEKKEKELINCLRNERVVVKFLPKETAMVHNKNHVLYGGMAITAVRNFVVPRLSSSGIYKNVLTNDEKAYLEHVMGLEEGALSIHKRVDNFWDDSNPNGIGRVTLHKEDNYLNLSNPIDYIKYKILLANKDQICPSLQEYEERPKATYQFVIVSENAETQSNVSKLEATEQCWFEFGAIKNDKDALRVIIETFEKRPTSPQVRLDYLQSEIKRYIDKDPRRFLSVITDKLLPAKVLIKKGIDAGVISWRNNFYYWRKDGTPLCELGEESTLNTAARYLSSPKHADLKYTLEASVKEE